MDGKARNTNEPCGCGDCRSNLQEYLDGTLNKNQSLRIFLHLRDCDGCRIEHEQLQLLFKDLDSLPDISVPEGFDEAIMAAIPYAAYKEMAPLRAERVPVYLEEEFLPATVRAPLTRWLGGAVAIGTAGAHGLAGGPEWLLALTAVGAMPELLVRLQGLSRWATLIVRRSEG